MGSKNPVLVVATSDTCVHCTTYKERYRDHLVELLRQHGGIELIEINSEGGPPRPNPRYHPKYSRWIGWNPEFILFTGDTWHNHSAELVGSIMGGEMSNGKPKHIGGPKVNPDSIMAWISGELKTGKFQLRGRGGPPPRRGAGAGAGQHDVVVTSGGHPMVGGSHDSDDDTHESEAFAPPRTASSEARALAPLPTGSSGYVPTYGSRSYFRKRDLEDYGGK